MGRIESKFTSRDEFGNKAMNVSNISYNPLLSKIFCPALSPGQIMILTNNLGFVQMSVDMDCD